MCARVPVGTKVAMLLVAVLALAVTPPAAAWLPSPNGVAAGPVAASAGPGPGPLASPVAVDSPVPLAWPVASIGQPAEGCLSPALSVVKVLAVVLGALAALKLPLVLAKVLLAKVLLLLPLALPLALPLLVPFMFIASMLPLSGLGMDDSPAADGPAPASPSLPPAGGGPAGGGNASPVTPSGEEAEARGAWVERCVQRVACQLNTRASRKECARFRCAAVDWLGGT